MAITYIAHHFYPGHSIGGIFFVLNCIVLYRLGEAWPAGPWFEFLAGIKKRCPTTTAGISARLMSFTILARKGAFRSLLSRNPKFIRAKFFTPFFIRFFNSFVGSGITFRRVVYDVSPFHVLGCWVLKLSSSNNIPQIVRFNLIVPYVLISQSSDKFAPACSAFAKRYGEARH